MKYLCLVYEAATEPPPRELDARAGETLAYEAELRRGGHFLAGDALAGPEAATTVRVRNTKVTLSDGSLSGTGEWLAGFLLVEARDLNEAIQAAAKCPAARRGGVEVRPVRDIRNQSQGGGR
jgi:hypothetical protein